MGYGKILIALDGSKLSELALEQAVMVANTSANIHIVSVISEGAVSETAAFVSAVNAPAPAAKSWTPNFAPFDPHIENARSKYLDGVREWLEETGFHVAVTIANGDVAASILEVARRGFDVIIMATHSRTGIAKTVLGSVTDVVLNQAPCPVLVIPNRQ